MTGSSSRRQIGPAPVTLLLLALILLLAPPAFANVGVPILSLVWPVAWLLLLVIIPIEASVAQRVLGTDPARSIELAVRANLVSTALGIPLTWGWLSSLGMQDVSLRG